MKPSRLDWRRLFFIVGMALLLGIQAFQIPRRGIDPDELEHLHAAFCVWHNQIPYRDFFEHHAPALYWLAQPAFWLTGASLDTLWLLRAAMWCCSAATVWQVLRIGRHLGLTRAAETAAFWFVWSSIFQWKSLEFRPDVPATLLICGAIASLIRHRSGNVTAAVCAGLATLFTQKAIVPLACLSLASWIIDLACS
ncbi:MAG: hypothetical protein EHM42_14505, partial [Planctomycetaceae bacterium]